MHGRGSLRLLPELEAVVVGGGDQHVLARRRVHAPGAVEDAVVVAAKRGDRLARAVSGGVLDVVYQRLAGGAGRGQERAAGVELHALHLVLQKRPVLQPCGVGVVLAQLLEGPHVPKDDLAVVRARRDDLLVVRVGDADNVVAVILHEPDDLLVPHVVDPDALVERRRGHEVLLCHAQECDPVHCFQVLVQGAEDNAFAKVPHYALVIVPGGRHDLLVAVEVEAVDLVAMACQPVQEFASLVVPQVHRLVAGSTPQDVVRGLREGHGVEPAHPVGALLRGVAEGPDHLLGV
mmetsp:Transcript_8072/g.21556  ORF Transcript_8072/g.21556 Transcript_8072/m.21556 type:complete len:291 (+) Transcript_8072:204-1076(+)